MHQDFFIFERFKENVFKNLQSQGQTSLIFHNPSSVKSTFADVLKCLLGFFLFLSEYFLRGKNGLTLHTGSCICVCQVTLCEKNMT